MRKQALMGFLGIMLGFWPAFNVAYSGIKPVSIQLKFFMLPVVDQRGNRKTEPITIFLHVRENSHVRSVCRLVPRVRDAILQILIVDPLHATGKRVHANGSQHIVVDRVNHSLGKNTVTGFKVVRGAISFCRGTASKLPGARLGCMRVGAGLKKKKAKKSH